MINESTPSSEIVKGFLALLGIWLSWFLSHLGEIQQGLQMLATTATIIASLVYARYYWKKTKKETNDSN